MKRRVIFIIDGLGMGGAERLMIPMLRHLSREVFEPRVCVLQQKHGNPIAEDIRALDIPVDYLPVRRLRDLTAVPRMIRYLRDMGADLVHTQLEFANVIGNISARLMRLPSVCTVHVLPSEGSNIKRGLHQRLEGFILRSLCDRVIAVAEGPRQAHLAATGASPAQVITIYNGIDLSIFTDFDRAAARSAVRQELGIPQDARVLITVAVLRPEKGIEYMLRALPSILAVEPNAWYLIVGDGPRRSELLAEVERCGIQGRAIFAGMRSDIPRILAAGDLFVLPSLTEALPTVLAEAMAARLPIVASAVGGVAEMVVDGGNGRLVEPRDVEALSRACRDLLSDPAILRSMGEKGWEIANQKFSVQQEVVHLKDLYLELIEQYEK